MRTVEIGDRLLAIHFLIKFRSECKPRVLFWEDAAATQESSLIEVDTCFIEVYVDDDTTLTWNGAVAGNSVTFPLTETDTDVIWDTRPFNLIFMKPNRNVVLSGSVRVQR
jgi:hypothetical protein